MAPRRRTTGVDAGKSRDSITRESRGRFAKGCGSPNKKGRPKGIVDKRVQLRAMLEPAKEKLVAKAISLALKGNVHALRLCLERLIPVLKATSEPVAVAIPAGTLSQKADSVFAEAIAGKLNIDDAKQLVELLQGQAKLIEITDLLQRIERLEAKTEKGGRENGDSKSATQSNGSRSCR